MKRLTVLTLGLCCGLWYSLATAYLQPTHQNIAAAATSQSVLADINTLHNLGLRRSYIDETQTFPNYVNEDIEPDIGLSLTLGNKDILNLIGDGAMQEDINPRALTHFYDPTTDLGLGTGGLPPNCQAVLKGASSGINPVLPWVIAGYTFLPSPDWALEDKGYVNGQDYSYQDARRYFYSALTTPDKTTRDQYWGKTFQALGQVIHHIEDMAQPQHVRNDPHLYLFDQGLLSAEPCENHSLYEQYTNDMRGNPNFYLSPYSLDPSVFRTPRSFWKNKTSPGAGLAEFTNSNFFSAGTNMNSGRYSSPVVIGSTVCEFPDDGSNSSICPKDQSLSGQMTFFSTLVTDSYTGQTQLNPLATTKGFFDQDLNNIGSAYPLYTLNRFNFDAAHLYLIPRAVAYSTWMLNYFFRGKMEISLPDEGVYAIADSALPAGSDPQASGFMIVKLKLRNLTGGTDNTGQAKEPIQSGSLGTLVAVAKFHRNKCYRQDLSGEYGSRADAAGQQDWVDNCRDPNEEMVVSDVTQVPDGVNSSAQEVTFHFFDEIPFSATDLYLQVIYQGPLGQSPDSLGNEPDAVVVTTKDISEPTYLFNYSNWDIDPFCAVYPDFSGRAGDCVGATLVNFDHWCTASGNIDAFPDDATCSRMATYTLRTQFSPTSAPIPGYDAANPATGPDGRPILPNSNYPISDIQAFHPLADLPALPVWPSTGTAGSTPGNLARVAVLVDTATNNLQMLLSEQDDTVNNMNDFGWHDITFAPTINQLDDDGVWQSTAPRYQLSRGQYIDPYYLIPMGDPSSYIFGISPLQLQCSQISPVFGGSHDCNWTPPFVESW